MEAGSEEATSAEDDCQIMLSHADVELRRGWRRKKQQLFLFKDFLVVSNAKNKKKIKIKHVIPLNLLRMDDDGDTERRGCLFANKSLRLGWAMENVVATFRSSDEKNLWHSFLQGYIDEAKENDKRRSIPLRIFTKDISSCDSPLIVSATKFDTVDDIIHKSLRRLGKTNPESDYQLWFQSGKNQDPYPLYGFEHPYLIRISELQNTSFVPLWPKVCCLFLNLRDMVLEQESKRVQGRFFLKRRGQEQSQGTVRSRWPFINRAYRRRSSSTCQDNLGQDQPVTKTLPLFGTSLSDICENGDLSPILDMMSFISRNGPPVKGILQKSAKRKSCTSLKEKLNSGEKVDWSRESVHVVAAVIKDFLQNIEECVLTSGLYDQWLAVLDQDSKEEKINSIRRLLQDLPTINIILLKYLFKMLYDINRNSSVNRMTAHHLSTSMAPSILWLPSACTSGVQKDLPRKISVIQFMLENCLEIFVDDADSFCGKSPEPCDVLIIVADKDAETIKLPRHSKPADCILLLKESKWSVLWTDPSTWNRIFYRKFIRSIFGVYEELSGNFEK